MHQETKRILRTATMIMMAIVFVGCSGDECEGKAPKLMVRNETNSPVAVKVSGTGLGGDQIPNMKPHSEIEFQIMPDSSYDVAILPDSYLSELTNSRNGLYDSLYGTDWNGQPILKGPLGHEGDRALTDKMQTALKELDRKISQEKKSSKRAVASCQVQFKSGTTEAGTGSFLVYARITTDSKGSLQLACGGQ